MLKISVYLYLFLFLIAISANTASTALKLTVIKKAHGQVIADMILYSVREKQNIMILSVRNVINSVKNSI